MSARNRELLANLLRRADAVYHFAAYQDYLPDFSRFTDVTVVSTSLIYEIAVAEGLDLQRVVVASSQRAMGEGLYRCPRDGDQTPGMRPEQLEGESKDAKVGFDLRVTTDYRTVLGEILAARCGQQRHAAVFPSHALTPLGVVRA